MLPPALVSVYREYKKDTNSITSWHASTAKECGYPADLLSNSLPPKQPAPRLKGKARAEAKKKAKPPQEATPQKEGPRYVIEIKDFVPVAECISVYKKPALSVPRAFFTTLNRVIKARSDFGDELAASNEKVDAKSDARHFYFVGILEKVREILKPYSDPVDSGSSKETETLTNKFKELEVYHPSEEFLNAKDIERPGPANNDPIVYKADPGDSCNISIEILAKIPWMGVTDIYPDGTFGVLDPHTDWPDKSMSQALTEERVIIAELWTEALALVYQVPDYPFSDEFLRGVKQFKETKQVPFSVIFAVQVILDVHKAIGSHAESSVETLLKRITTMNEELKAHIEFQKDIKSPRWSPILAGLALYYHRAEMHEAGLRVTNAWGSIILPAHLEDVISEEGLTKTWWLDMETLFKIFGDEAFFVGGKPHTRSDYVNRFMLQVGISASTLSKNRRKGKKMALEDF
ncbi:hypothetical protein FDENT_3858 [Fusarium denticulatum]|uniref:DUF6604 domain-containing protein n=1 Tax=Fusarium denticulatum TaxID=48507 RepID=A0A8H5UHA0_9HYPO|nr:hypothetical protein FDENT_3858 [Fusarium denticulatum]